MRLRHVGGLLAALAVFAGGFAAPISFSASTSSQSASYGSVAGRVVNSLRGDYLANVRVSIDGVPGEVLTNSFGEFRVDHLPPGPATLRAMISGHGTTSRPVEIVAGQVITAEVDVAATRSQESTVQLDVFHVAARREMDASSIAINERRFAGNLKNVVAADEFGDSTEGNVGEFVKLLPGVSIDYNAADPRFISVRGLPSFGTAVNIDGNPVASASVNFSRAVEVDQVSINNMSRIEISKSPTPDTPASMIGGSVNMVLKSSFERARPSLDFRTHVNANFNGAQGIDFATFDRGPGPLDGHSIKIKPGFDFTYIRPVTKNLGFTLTGLTSKQFTPDEAVTSRWLPATSGSALVPADRPFLDGVTVRDIAKEISRYSYGATVDWRPRAGSVVTAAATWNRVDIPYMISNLTFGAVGSRAAAPAAHGPTFMQSAAGAANVALQNDSQHKIGTGYNLRLTHRHSGKEWDMMQGASYSGSSSHFRDTEYGQVKNVNAVLSGVTLRYDDIVDSRPAGVTVTDGAGAPVDFRSLRNYTRITSIVSAPNSHRVAVSNAFANMTRKFGGARPFALKAGADVRREDRDYRGYNNTWAFVGPDGAANTVDDQLRNYDLLFDRYAGVPLPFGYGRADKPSVFKVHSLMQTRPEYFRLNEAAAITAATAQSRKLIETVGSGYLRADASLFSRRLKLVGGVRYEHTTAEGYGQLNDPQATYQRDATGALVRDANGRPVRLPGDAAALARLQFRDRGAHAKRSYADYYPSVNATFALTERLLLRSSYARTITRPQLTNIVPSISISDPASTGTPTVTVSNPDLRPWTSDSYDLALEYYFELPGVISAGVFRKDIRDFFGSTATPATPELLAAYGLDNSFDEHRFVYRANVGSARVSGMEFEYRQSLTWLPKWASGISVFANGTFLHLEGAAAADFSGFISKSLNWGVALSRPRYALRLNWNNRGRQRNGAVTGANIPAGTYAYNEERLYLDMNAEWRFTRRLTVFANIRNINEPVLRASTYGAATPDYARSTLWQEFGAQGIFGLKGRF